MDELRFKVFKELGETYLKLAKFKEAKANFENALKENPDSEECYIGLAMIEIKNKNLKKAEELIKKAEEINPDNTKIKETLGILKFYQDKLDESYNILKKVLNNDYNNVQALIFFQKLAYKLEIYEDLENFLKIFHNNNPSDTNILYALCACLYFQDKLDEAKEFIEKLIVIDKENVKAIELKDIIEKKINAINS